jgi:hypothetical protein
MHEIDAFQCNEIEARELIGIKDQFKRQKANLRKPSMSLNEVDIKEWDTALANASNYERKIRARFCFHEDGKDFMRVN